MNTYSEIKNFLNYVDNGTIAGDFVQKLDAAVLSVKSNQKVRKNFMTYQMALLESKLEGEEKGRLQGIESVAFNMIKKGMALETISELTELSITHLISCR